MYIRDNIHRFTVALAAVFCMVAFSVTAYAGDTDPDPKPLPGTTETPSPEGMEGPTTGRIEVEPKDVPVAPKGNAVLVDNLFGDKQLIIVTTKAGNYSYILIDRANEDKETAVHFSNRMDNADLRTLLRDDEIEPEHCTCTTKYEVGAVNANCLACKDNRNTYTEPEPEAPRPKEAKLQGEKPNGICELVVFLAAVLAGDGTAFYYPKFRKPKEGVRDDDDLAEYDLGYDENDEEEAPEPDDTQEPEKDWLIEKEAPERNKEDKE